MSWFWIVYLVALVVLCVTLPLLYIWEKRQLSTTSTTLYLSDLFVPVLAILCPIVNIFVLVSTVMYFIEEVAPTIKVLE